MLQEKSCFCSNYHDFQKNHKFDPKKEPDIEYFDNVNIDNYLALYVSIISPITISVEKSFEIIKGMDTIPRENVVTVELFNKIKKYLRQTPLRKTQRFEKAEKLFKVNQYKILAYLKGTLIPIKEKRDIREERTLASYRNLL